MNNKFKNNPSGFGKLKFISYMMRNFRFQDSSFVNIQAHRGFTLVEMLVSISVFMVVMLVAASSLLSIIDGNNKAQSLKSAINNLNFALESMQKNIRVGNLYYCDYTSGDCPRGSSVISFTSYKDLNGDGVINDIVTYRLKDDSIERCDSVTSACLSSSPNFMKLTAPEIKITNLMFYVDNRDQPRVLLTVGGEAGTKERIKTKFNLQTTVSQRGF